MYVRWMGAFRHGGQSLSECFDFEMTRETPAACEKLSGKGHGKSVLRDNVRVGLMVSPKGIYRRFTRDVWSEYDESGNLYVTSRYGTNSNSEAECWTRAGFYDGIVIRHGSLATLRSDAREAVLSAHSRYGLPVFRLVKGKLIAETHDGVVLN